MCVFMTSTKVNGVALEALRTRSDLSLRQLSELSGVSFRHIRAIEQGGGASWGIVQKLAAGLKVHPTALLADPTTAPQDIEVAS